MDYGANKDPNSGVVIEALDTEQKFMLSKIKPLEYESTDSLDEKLDELDESLKKLTEEMNDLHEREPLDGNPDDAAEEEDISKRKNEIDAEMQRKEELKKEYEKERHEIKERNEEKMEKNSKMGFSVDFNSLLDEKSEKDN